MTTRLTASQLAAGDVCAGSGAIIHRVVRDGLFMRTADDKKTSQRFPRGKVEVAVEYPGSPIRVDYWNARTTLSVHRNAAREHVRAHALGLAVARS